MCISGSPAVGYGVSMKIISFFVVSNKPYINKYFCISLLRFAIRSGKHLVDTFHMGHTVLPDRNQPRPVRISFFAHVLCTCGNVWCMQNW